MYNIFFDVWVGGGGGGQGYHNHISDLAVGSAMSDFEPDSTAVYNMRSSN